MSKIELKKHTTYYSMLHVLRCGFSCLLLYILLYSKVTFTDRPFSTFRCVLACIILRVSFIYFVTGYFVPDESWEAIQSVGKVGEPAQVYTRIKQAIKTKNQRACKMYACCVIKLWWKYIVKIYIFALVLQNSITSILKYATVACHSLKWQCEEIF